VTGGIYFTTLQKFGRTGEERAAGAEHPLLSDRPTSSSSSTRRTAATTTTSTATPDTSRTPCPTPRSSHSLARRSPSSDRNTREVFGDYVDVYDLSRAVADGATVPVTFEPRLIKVALRRAGLSGGGHRPGRRRSCCRARRRRARAHREERSPSSTPSTERPTASALSLRTSWITGRTAAREMAKFIDAPGKAMIVGATRQICADLYAAIVAIRPDWHSDELDKRPHQGGLQRNALRTRQSIAVTCDATRRTTRPSRNGCARSTTSSRSSSSRT
jgi:type I restriction enzyme R subunit